MALNLEAASEYSENNILGDKIYIENSQRKKFDFNRLFTDMVKI